MASVTKFEYKTEEEYKNAQKLFDIVHNNNDGDQGCWFINQTELNDEANDSVKEVSKEKEYTKIKVYVNGKKRKLNTITTTDIIKMESNEKSVYDDLLRYFN